MKQAVNLFPNMEDTFENKFNKRSCPRFLITDKRKWSLKINGKDVPVNWIHDISPYGIKLRLSDKDKYSSGDKVKIRIQFLGKDFVSTEAKIKWSKKYSESINMRLFGTEFDSIKPLWLPNEETKHHLFPVTKTPEGSEAPSALETFASKLVDSYRPVILSITVFSFAIGCLKSII